MKYTLQQVKEANDQVRKTLIPVPGRSQIYLTPGVSEADNRGEILQAVREFDNWTGDNDPHGEHDFGQVVVNKIKYFFKIDYYDMNLEFGVDPKEEDCIRVLTIMEASEY